MNKEEGQIARLFYVKVCCVHFGAAVRLIFHIES
jgi:hypothetical protein